MELDDIQEVEEHLEHRSYHSKKLSLNQIFVILILFTFSIVIQISSPLAQIQISLGKHCIIMSPCKSPPSGLFSLPDPLDPAVDGRVPVLEDPGSGWGGQAAKCYTAKHHQCGADNLKMKFKFNRKLMSYKDYKAGEQYR
jgi:hypothetical protein